MVLVKKPKTEKRKGGRPFGVPEDRRTERLAIRCHPDLVAELTVVAREEGYVRSVLIERVLIAYVNHFRNGPMLDAIGRYTQSTATSQFPRGNPLSRSIRTNPGGAFDHPTRQLKPGK